MTADTVTVVIPTRRRDDLLQRALRSVAAQTVPPLEVIVVGDGWTPVVSDDLGLDLRIVSAPADTGAAECRNIGARQARGDWVALLDDDDEWLPTKLERQVDLAARTGANVVACRVEARSALARLEWPRRLPSRGEPMSHYLLCRRELLMGETLVQTSMLLVRTPVLVQTPFTRGLRRHQEWDWLLRLEAAGDVTLAFVPTVESIWHSIDAADRITNATDWRTSLQWAQQLGTLAQPSEVRAFILTFVPRIARQAGDLRALPELLRAAFEAGRPTVRELALFAAVWLAPQPSSAVGRCGRRLRGLLAGRRAEAGEAPQPRGRSAVVMVQPYVASYRVPFFERLRSELAARGIDLALLVGQATAGGAARRDSVRLPWATEVRSRSVKIPGGVVRFKRGWRGPPPDLMILPHGSTWLDNYPVLLRGRTPVALWGQGRAFTSAGHRIDVRLERWQLSRAVHYFAYTRGALPALEAEGWSADRVTVVNNTVDTDVLAAWVDEARRCPPVPRRGGPAAMFVGSLDPAKRLPFLIAAADRIAAAEPTFHLSIAGHGKDEDLVRRAAAERPWLEYVGAADDRTKARLAAASDMILMPGRVGLVAVDSLVLGVPIVTTAWRWHGPEFDYLDATNAVVTADDVESYARAVVDLCADPPRLRLLSDGCLAQRDRYSMTAMVAQFVEGVQTALRSR